MAATQSPSCLGLIWRLDGAGEHCARERLQLLDWSKRMGLEQTVDPSGRAQGDWWAARRACGKHIGRTGEKAVIGDKGGWVCVWTVGGVR